MNSEDNTDQPSQEISKVIANVDKTIASMEEKAASNKNIKLDQKTQSQIISDIEALNASLVDMSKVCLKKIDEMSKNLPYLQTQIDEMDGILDFVKETTGSVLLGDFTKDNQRTNIQDQQDNQDLNYVILNASKSKEFTFPGEGYSINIEVLNQVGRKVEEQTSKQELIIPIEPNNIEKRKKAWTMQSDFFKSPDSSIKSNTSFDSLYS